MNMITRRSPRYPNQTISWKHLDRAIAIERKVIDILQYPIYFFYWLNDQARWAVSERGRMKKKRIRSVDEIEQGQIYYNRHPDPDSAAFCVFYQEWSEWDDDYCIYYIHITESSLLGRDNTVWVKRCVADEKGWPYETDYLSYDSNEWSIPEDVDFEGIDEWLDRNVPPEDRLVLADLGMEGIKPAFDTIVTEDQIKEDIDIRNLYLVLETDVLDMLESYGLYNDYNRWRKHFEESGSDED